MMSVRGAAVPGVGSGEGLGLSVGLGLELGLGLGEGDAVAAASLAFVLSSSGLGVGSGDGLGLGVGVGVAATDVDDNAVLPLPPGFISAASLAQADMAKAMSVARATINSCDFIEFTSVHPFVFRVGYEEGC